MADGNALRYVSTRGQAPALSFADVLLCGLARDGGLYVPETWPIFSPAEFEAMRGLSYAELAARVMRPFLADALDDVTLEGMTAAAYAGFDHAAVTPLVQIGPSSWLLELFHGPTLAFKDLALQLLGRLFDHELARREEWVTVVGATSGDTGSAAIEAFRGRSRARVFILHPHGRVSEVQRRQMTTVTDANVHNIAIAGSFDDCQALVKAMFNDHAFRDACRLAAVNSINWARVLAQVVYYVHAALSLGTPEREVAFSVPTGNFGDVFAGYVAARLGLPVARLIVATNRNDILARTFATGRYAVETVVPTLSPSMDIQVSSNFERLLFDLYGRDGGRVAALMADLAAAGAFILDRGALEGARGLFSACRVDEDETLATIAALHRECGLLLDPHSAVGLAAARRQSEPRGTPMVTLATAHPAKFPEAVRRATGITPALPPHLADLLTRPERYDVLPNDLAAVQTYIRARL